MIIYLFIFFQFNGKWVNPSLIHISKEGSETCFHFKRMTCLPSKVVKARAFWTGNERSATSDMLIIAESLFRSRLLQGILQSFKYFMSHNQIISDILTTYDWDPPVNVCTDAALTERYIDISIVSGHVLHILMMY